MIRYFSDSKSLMDFVKNNNVYRWHGDYGIGSLTFIDSDYSDLHVVFDSRADYERWKEGAADEPCQFCLC